MMLRVSVLLALITVARTPRRAKYRGKIGGIGAAELRGIKQVAKTQDDCAKVSWSVPDYVVCLI
jgi:hypothetical protein